MEKIRLQQEADKKKIDEQQREIEQNRKDFEEKKRKAKLKKDQEEFERQAKIKAEAAAAQKVIDAAKEKEAKDRAEEVEKAKKAALAPDKEKLTNWIASFNETNNPTPQLKSKKAKEIHRTAFDQLVIILQDAQDKIDKL